MNPAAHTVAEDEMTNTHTNDETRVLYHWWPHMNERNACELSSHRSDNLPALSHSLSDVAIVKKLIASFDYDPGILGDQECIFPVIQHNKSKWFDLISQCLKAAHTMPRSCVTKATPLYGGNFRIIDTNIWNKYEKFDLFLHPARIRAREMYFPFFSAN